MSSFHVRSKIFVTIPAKGDVIHVFVDDDERERTLAMYPEWIEKPMWRDKVAGLRVTLASAAAPIVKALVGKAYQQRAAKR